MPSLLHDIAFTLPHPQVVCQRVDVSTSCAVRVVRDDLLHPIANGNKVRKLDALLPHLQSQGVEQVVTCGGAQSSHASAVAVLGAARGLCVHLLLRGEAPDPLTGYTLLSSIFGHVHWVPRREYADRDTMFQRFVDSRGEETAVIPEGGASLYALYGLVRLVGALAQPLDRAPGIRLVIDAGTGTTAVGLALGILACDLPWTVEAVMLMPDDTAAYAAQTRQLLDLWSDAHGPVGGGLPLTWHPRQRPRRFGKLDPDEASRCVDIARRTGVLFDPIYTLAAVDHVLAMNQEAAQDAVVIHTGGTLNVFGIAQRLPAHHWLREP